MKAFVFVLLVIISQNSGAQNQYYHIPRSKIYVPIIKEFYLDSISGNLLNKNNRNEVIQSYDLEGGNFESNARTFNSEGFTKKGLNVISIQDTVVDGFQAILAVLTNELNKLEMVALTFGDENFSVMISAIYSIHKDPYKKQLIQQALLGSKYNNEDTINPFEGTKFRLLEDSNFKFYQFAAGAFRYQNNIDTSESVLISQLPFSPGQKLVSIAASAILQAESEGWNEFEFDEEVYCHKDKATCYSISGSCSINSVSKIFYYHFFTNKDNVVICLMAVISANKPEILQQAKSLATKIYFI